LTYLGASDVGLFQIQRYFQTPVNKPIRKNVPQVNNVSSLALSI